MCEMCGKVFPLEQVMYIGGKFRCAKCQAVATSLRSALPVEERFDLRAARRKVLGCAVVLLAAFLGVFALLLVPYFRIRTLNRCQNHLRAIYMGLSAYAQEHDTLFPGRNNDLRVLFEGRYAVEMRIFVCPGTHNTVRAVADLRDDRAEPSGPGMSYFYQAGHTRTLRLHPLQVVMWDQGEGNHRSRGVNVLHTDGTVGFSGTMPHLTDPAEVLQSH